MVKHPVYPLEASQGRVDALEAGVATAMAMSEEEMLALVPDRTGFVFMGCPNCDEGTQEGQLSWSIDDPHHVKCRFCETVFPNDQYPDDQVLKVTNPVGAEAAYPYWEDETGYRYFFGGKAWRAARTYFSAQAQDLGALYQMTGDRAYARRATLILDAFARYYPGFLVSQDWPHRPKGFVLEPPYPGGGGKWGRWRHDEMPTSLVYAYDSVYASGELERLADEVGADVKGRIETDFFRGAVRQDQYHETDYSNAAPRIYQGYIVIGRVLGDPALVHEGVRQSRGIYARQFYVDGFWREGSVSYHQMTIGGMKGVFGALRGNSDPPGYTDSTDGTRFDGIDLEQDIPIIARANRISEICRYPDGRTMPVHDNWARFVNLRIPERSSSTLLAGVGHAWLGRGEGEHQTQVHLHFSGGYGHEHADNLSMAIHARGLELLPDLGYTHTRQRAWSTSTLCHNTVVIDEQRQHTRGGGRPSDGRLNAFETAFGTVQWVEARGEAAYPELAEVYRRTMALISAGGDRDYVVDLFRVGGGSQHDWAIHGSADYDSRAAVDVPLEAYGENLLPGVKIRQPTGEADRGDAEGRNPSYAYFQNVSRGEADDGVTVSLDVPERDTGVRTHLPGQGGAEVFLGDAMSFRRAEENDVRLDQYRMPIFLLRRTGEAPLTSRFAAVHEPHSGETFIQDVSLAEVEGAADTVAIVVRHGEFTDHIVHQTDPTAEARIGADFVLRGEMGFVRERDGVPVSMGLWGGSELRWGNHVLTGGGILTGRVSRALRLEAGGDCNGLVLDADLPEGDALKGAVAIVTFGDGSTRGCLVGEVTKTGSEVHLVLADDPGFAVEDGGARHLFFPLREMAGEVTCAIRTSAFVTVGDGKLASVGKAGLSST